MRLELCNQSKYRGSGRLGDDVPLIVPGGVYGVFDGATDPRGTMVGNVGAGRIAAETVASTVAAMARDSATPDMDAERIIGHLSDALEARTQPLGLAIPPSTTLAIVFDCGDSWRFLILGDTGIRLNRDEVLRREKLIDEVSTHARVAVFRELQRSGEAPDTIERKARAAILLGFDQAVENGTISRAFADRVMDETALRTGLVDWSSTVRQFLSGGIQTQFRFGNARGNPLCFDTMNGTRPVLGETIDLRRPKAAIRSIEIFSDGYVDMPEAFGVAAWERRFEETEALDYHKTGGFAGVKGSTSDEVFDDRTVITLGEL